MTSLSQFLKKSGTQSDLALLIEKGIAASVAEIKEVLSKGRGELAGSENASGEKQLALDVASNEIVVEKLKACGVVGLLASEEMETEMKIDGGKYVVVFDPLDGSSLVDANFAVGSIFGVYEDASKGIIGRRGGEQVAACYAVYGPRTILVLTLGKGVHEFRLENDRQFYLIKENLTLAPEPKHFAPGNLRAAAERKEYLELTNSWIKAGLTLRYSGGMVPDAHHILVKGEGIFAYPGYSKAPEGKLRLVFECNPFAFIMTQAGGSANDGKEDILKKPIAALHQRSPIYMGSTSGVDQCRSSLG